MLPEGWSFEVRAFCPITALPAVEVEALIHRAARNTPLSSADAEEQASIVAAAHNGLVIPSGSVVVMATRSPG